MKTVLILLLSFLFLNIFSITKNDSLNFYYKNVIFAEENLVIDKYENASSFYIKAFEYKKYPFAKDLKNAILAELFSLKRKDILNKNFILFLEISGFEINEIKYSDKNTGFGGIEIFPNSFKEEIDWNYFNKNKPNYSLNNNLISQLKEIHKRDQKVRTECTEKFGHNIYVTCKDTIAIIDSINYYLMLTILTTQNLEERFIGYKNNITDISAYKVCQWLEYFNVPYLLILDNDSFDIIKNNI